MSHHYCILPNRNCIDAFIKGQQGKETAATKALSNTILGNWIYLNAEFVIACVQKKSLIDPKGYVSEVDESAIAQFKTMKYISMAPQLQRQSNPLRHGSLTYHTEMRKYKNTLKKAALKRKLDDVEYLKTYLIYYYVSFITKLFRALKVPNNCQQSFESSCQSFKFGTFLRSENAFTH